MNTRLRQQIQLHSTWVDLTTKTCQTDMQNGEKNFLIERSRRGTCQNSSKLRKRVSNSITFCVRYRQMEI